ncbi:MAG: ABC transporter permease [Planctomycetia bacterium]|nr:MAG: ABC transporter permease [Planctomycetia bacterium]
MTRIWAIARLTFWEGVRMRIVLVFVIVLALLVLNMPFWLRGDETLAGRVQNFLDYGLNAASLCLALATIFLSCSTLAGEIRNNVIHLVVTKPVRRFEILCGKWLGVMLLNTAVLALCAGAIYFFASYLRAQPVEFERDRMKLDQSVWTARHAARPVEPDFRADATRDVEKRIADGALQPSDRLSALRERNKELRDQWLVIRPNQLKTFEFENLPVQRPVEKVAAEVSSEAAADDPHLIQVTFRARGLPIPQDELLPLAWVFNDPETGAPLMPMPFVTKQRSGDTHAFFVRDTVVMNGKASLTVAAWDEGDGRGRNTTVTFEGRTALMLYYPAGTFEVNYLKALVIILLRLGFLAAMGLFFSTFVSFPVACFCVFTWLMICVAKPWWMSALGADLDVEGWDASVDPFGEWGPLVRGFLLGPLLNFGFPDFTRYDGTTALVDGLLISGDTLWMTLLHTLGFGLAMLLVVGWYIFDRREIAETQL